MSDKFNPERQAEWQTYIEQFQASGLSANRFCQDHGLVYHQFLYWRQKLTGSRRADRNVVTAHESGFSRVVVRDHLVEHDLSLHLPNGLCIRGVSHHNLDLVKALLVQL